MPRAAPVSLSWRFQLPASAAVAAPVAVTNLSTPITFALPPPLPGGAGTRPVRVLAASAAGQWWHGLLFLRGMHCGAQPAASGREHRLGVVRDWL